MLLLPCQERWLQRSKADLSVALELQRAPKTSPILKTPAAKRMVEGWEGPGYFIRSSHTSVSTLPPRRPGDALPEGIPAKREPWPGSGGVLHMAQEALPPKPLPGGDDPLEYKWEGYCLVFSDTPRPLLCTL